MTIYARNLYLLAFIVFLAGVTMFVAASSKVAADPLPKKKIVDVREMSVKDRADLGEKLIFGAVGANGTQGAIGKAQCPLCHDFQEGVLSERAPNLWGIPYKKRNKENALEYLAESHVCPSCYVVGGFSHGTESESSMPAVHQPPINLTVDELIAIDTWIYYREGLVPPTPQEIEQAYRKFISESEWPNASRVPEVYPARYPDSYGTVNLTGQEPLNEIFTRALCFACHTIPGIPGSVGAVGPKLVMKTIAPTRLKDPAYKGKATDIRGYVTESIVDPSIYVVKGYPDIMPKDYGTKLTAAALEKMVNYLSHLEEGEEPPKIQ